MPELRRVNASDNEQENAEVVGTSNLADVLKERGAIRGSWFLNGHEFRDFAAHSPADVHRQINTATNKHGITASIDDGYHLVLTADGPGEISIASGFGADQDRKQQETIARDKGRSDMERDYAAHKEREAAKDQPEPMDVLEMLGLTETDDPQVARGTDWAPGESADARKERMESEKKSGGLRKSPNQRQQTGILGGTVAQDAETLKKQGTDGGGTTGMNKGASNTVDANPHAGAPGGPGEGSAGGSAGIETGGTGLPPVENPKAGTTPSTTEHPSS